MKDQLTIDQKIELLKIAAAADAPLGSVYNSIDATVKNYKKLLEAISTSPFPTIQ